MTRRPSARKIAGTEGRNHGARPIKRSLAINGHPTSISLEHAFWEALKTSAAMQGISLVQLVARIDAARGDAGLSSAVRVWLLEHYMARSLTEPADTQQATDTH